MSRRLLLLLLTAALSLVLGFWTFTPAQAVTVVRWGGYWLTLAAVLVFVVALARSLRDTGAVWHRWREWGAPVGVALAAAGFLHLHEPHEFKIVADEVVLQLTAKQLHFAREAAVVGRGYEYAGNFTPLVSYVDKRPLLFPFLVSALHDLTGFRPANAHILNAALSVALMLLLLVVGRRIAGWGGGIALVLLVATIPLVAQNACGAGFELLNLVMILATIWLGMRAAEQPANDDRLGAFVASGVLLALVRYESVLFVAPVAAGVCYVWWRQREVRVPWVLWLAPLLLVIVPLQLNVFKLSSAAWQLEDVSGADAPFSARYFYDNVGHALNFFLATDGLQPNSLLVAVAGALGVGLFVLVLYRRSRAIFREQPANAVLAIFLVGLLAHTALMLCYFWGKWDDPIIRRLSLPAHLLLVLALIFVWTDLVPHRRRWPILSGVALAYLFVFTIPSNAMHRFTQENFAARSTNWLGGHVRALGDESALGIGRSGRLQWFLHGKSCVDAEDIARRPDALLAHFRNRSFAHVLVVQRLTPQFGTGVRRVHREDDLGEGVTLQLIEERAFAPFYLVALSRVVAIDEAKFRAWAADYVKRPAPPRPPVDPAAQQAESEQLLEWLRQLP